MVDMQKLNSEFELGLHSASSIGSVNSNRMAAVLLDEAILNAISASVPRPKKTISQREVSEPGPSPRLHASNEMARLLTPDLQGLHRWD
jgi:hypothetical protein